MKKPKVHRFDVERLRHAICDDGNDGQLVEDAADEIERLKHENTKLREELLSEQKALLQIRDCAERVSPCGQCVECLKQTVNDLTTIDIKLLRDQLREANELLCECEEFVSEGAAAIVCPADNIWSRLLKKLELRKFNP